MYTMSQKHREFLHWLCRKIPLFLLLSFLVLAPRSRLSTTVIQLAVLIKNLSTTDRTTSTITMSLEWYLGTEPLQQSPCRWNGILARPEHNIQNHFNNHHVVGMVSWQGPSTTYRTTSTITMSLEWHLAKARALLIDMLCYVFSA